MIEPVVIDLTLKQGWTTMTLKAAGGNSRPIDLGMSQDARVLGIAVSPIDIVTK